VRQTASAYDVVLFDADGVLQYPKPGWEEAFGRLGREFTREVFDLEDAYLRGESGIREAVAELVSARGGTPQDAAAMSAAWDGIDVDPAAMAVVDEVRASGVATHLASNQHDVRAALMREFPAYRASLGELFFSCDLGLRKPDPAYFTAIIDRLGVPPHRVLFVDDLPRNVAGAEEAGLAADVHVWADGAAGLREIFVRRGVLPA